MGATDPAADQPADQALARLRAEVAESAHDLSNALGAILNYAAFLAEDLAETPAASQYLPHLQSAAQRALVVVDRLTSTSGAR